MTFRKYRITAFRQLLIQQAEREAEVKATVKKPAEMLIPPPKNELERPRSAYVLH